MKQTHAHFAQNTIHFGHSWSSANLMIGWLHEFDIFLPVGNSALPESIRLGVVDVSAGRDKKPEILKCDVVVINEFLGLNEGALEVFLGVIERSFEINHECFVWKFFCFFYC